MITMEMFGKVRRMFYRDGMSRSEIAKRTGLSRTTVQKWVKAPAGSAPKYQRAGRPGKLTPFKEDLLQALKADARRPRRERRTALKLLSMIQAKGYSGGYTAVTDFVRAWHASHGQSAVRAFVPLQFEPGDAHQFDWSEEHLVIGGVWRKIMAAHLKLCFSRAFVVQAYPTQSHEMLFDAHTRAFATLGGVARRGIYDNMKTAVDKVKKGKARPASSIPGSPPWRRITSSIQNSAMSPPAGRKASSRRMSKIVGDGFGRKLPGSDSAPSPS